MTYSTVISLIEFDPLLYCIAFIVIVLATIMQSAVGMGFGMLAAPVFLLIDPALVPGVILIIGVPLGIWVTWRDRAFVVVSELKSALIGRLVGSLVAAQLMASLLSPESFKVLFSVVILLIVLLSIFRISPVLSLRNLFAAGLVSGITGTVAGLGGPPMGLIYQHGSGEKVRGTLNAILAFGGVVSLVVLVFYHLITLKSLVYAVGLLPGLLIGMKMAPLVEHFVNQRFRPVILGVCGLYAIFTLVTAIY
ncbi:TSUP family transporter [Amphritea sp.]|uniref:TSUP family transporter n=1 Tax=Amphritea sp. TaxID=1872502 RepID=UPI003A9080F0